MSLAVEEGVNQGWHRAHKHLDPGQSPTQSQAVEDIKEAVMLSIQDYFTFDTSEEEDGQGLTVRDQILGIVKEALDVRNKALCKENISVLGYPYFSGYLEAALTRISSLVS